MLEAIEYLFYALLIAVVAASYARSYLERDDPTPEEQARQAFARGEIDHQELEARLDVHLDERNDRIRAVVERVNGVGPATSTAIAREYESLDDLRASDRERLEAVSGVGEKTGEAVLERVRE